MKYVPDPHRIEVISDDVVRMMKSKTPAEKIALVGTANRTGRLLMAAGIRILHPDWTEEQVQQEIILRMNHPS
ncbi:MAG: hypothetical protein LC104_04190 [Bacteroidales bacterium]|nr:hypothetical protein [Bacteroidales bacterium]